MNGHSIWAVMHKAWGINSHKYLIRLMKNTTSAEIWQLPQSAFKAKFPFIPEQLVGQYFEFKKEVTLDKLNESLDQQQVTLLGYYDDQYPEKLRQIYDPPALLYCKGQLDIPSIAIALVGSRKCTTYGKNVAAEFAKNLSANNVQVISGLAKGIDTSGHQGALLHDGGTVAVLGCGIDVIYPRENRQLFYDIVQHNNSAIISDLPLGSQPLKYHFPLRNRIISGLSDGLVIIEAASRSGALITAELALEQGKNVFAVPGPITSEQSQGTNKLIKDGAKIVTNIDDILEEYGQLCLFTEKTVQDNTVPLTTVPLTDDEEKVLTVLGAEPLTIDEIGFMTKMPIADLMATLSWLEVNGLVQQIVGRKFMRLG